MKIKDVIQEARSPEEFMSQLRSTAPDIKQVYQKYLKSPHYRPFRTSDDSTSEYHNWTDNFAQFLRKEFGHMPQDLAFEIGNHLYDYIKMRNREDPEGVAENDPNSSSSSFDTNIGNVKLGASSSGLTASVGSPPGVSASITASPSNLKNPTVGLSAGNPNQGLSASVSAPANNLSNPSAMIQYKKTFEKKIGESGSFSYGAKKPRKGSVADLADKRRQEQERGKQPIEPKDQMVGVAKVTKGVTEGTMRSTKKLKSTLYGIFSQIYAGAMDGEEMIDYVADELGDYYRAVELSKDPTIQRAYSLMREKGGDSEGDPKQMSRVAWDAMSILRGEQGVAEGKKPDRYHIVDKDGKPVNLASYADRASAIKDRDEKYPGAVVQQVGPRGKVKGVAEGSLNEGQYEMMMRNGQVKKFIAKDDADAKRIAAGHGAKSVIRLKGGVPAGKVAEQGVVEGLETNLNPDNIAALLRSESSYGDGQDGDILMHATTHLVKKLKYDRQKAVNLIYKTPLGDQIVQAYHELRRQGVAEGIFDKLKQKFLPKPTPMPRDGNIIRVIGREVKINYVPGGYIGFTWRDKNGEEHTEEVYRGDYRGSQAGAELTKDIAAEIKHADNPGPMDPGVKAIIDRKRAEDPQLDDIMRRREEDEEEKPNLATMRTSSTIHEQDVAEGKQSCPECGGPSYSNPMLAEKKDACYHKVKSRVKVWPSAYASGQLVQCRKRGASNWGTGGKKK